MSSHSSDGLGFDGGGFDGDDVRVVATGALGREGAIWIGDRVDDAITERGGFTIALAGGTTPKALYVALADLRLPWDKVHVYFGDERCVPADHPDSNYAMAKAALFDEVPIPAENIHRIEAERADREAAASDYAALLPERLDVVILGMGEEGHTASLFPGGAWMNAAPGKKMMAVECPKPPPWRISILPSVIAAARARLVLATGAGKAARVAEALGAPAGLPVQLARPATWLLDAAAASQVQAIATPDGDVPVDS